MKTKELRTWLEAAGFRQDPYLPTNMIRNTGPFNETVAIKDGQKDPKEDFIVYYAFICRKNGFRSITSGSELMNNLYVVFYNDVDNHPRVERKALAVHNARIHNNFE